MPGEPHPGCAGIGLGIDKRVKLKRPVRDMVFLDGYYDPPRQVKRPPSLVR